MTSLSSNKGCPQTDTLQTTMLHILNGSSIEEPLRQSTIPGEYFSFRDALIAGPALSGLDENEWRRLRVAHLSNSYGVESTKCEKELLEQTQTLESFSQHEEVVMWFEHDLFCQLNLLYLLDWFAHVDLGQTKLSLVNIGEFPGKPNFRGLGELDATELASLFPQRQPVSTTQLEIASEAWRAFSSPDPTSIENLIRAETSSVPFLREALEAHLRRFPNTRNGLGQIENRSLELVKSGYEEFGDLFPEFIAAESVYGLGDTQVWLTLVNLSNASHPLLTAQNRNERTDQVGLKTLFKITDAGKAVLNGDSDFIKLNGIDQWLGGVHLQGNDQLWRWEETAGRLKYC
jgi:hypothetical protein